MANASLTDPFQYPDGISTVLVNGVPVWHDGAYLPHETAGEMIQNR